MNLEPIGEIRQSGHSAFCILNAALWLYVWLLLAPFWLAAAETTNDIPGLPRFLGSSSCSSSSCHGGAGENRDQLIVWERQDFHTRAFATLTRRRSDQIAEALQIDKPAENRRCTVCHAPFQGFSTATNSADLEPTHGVSCESCHGPAAAWLRSHTRRDFSHADRVAAGMRELRNLYYRANACVACHQNVPIDLLTAGHPPLLFELDGQAASEPRHWRERDAYHGPKSWLVGQAVALREASWQLEHEQNPDATLVTRWQGLLWVLQKAATALPRLPSLELIGSEPTANNFKSAQELSDKLAVQASELDWSTNLTRAFLQKLAAASTDFQAPGVGQLLSTARAERLVIALDRLFIALHGKEKATQQQPHSPADADLNNLYGLVQSLPDFDAPKFARQLREFEQKYSIIGSQP